MNPELKWVSCAQSDDFATSRKRHLIARERMGRPGATTLCGATGATGLEWRGNSTKPACTACLEKEASL